MNDSKEEQIGKCCNKKSLYSALYNNEPLENFRILLCEEHAFSEMFEKNLLKLEKLGVK
jgi:hypothetical protein